MTKMLPNLILKGKVKLEGFNENNISKNLATKREIYITAIPRRINKKHESQHRHGRMVFVMLRNRIF